MKEVIDCIENGDRILIGHWVNLYNGKKAFVRYDFIYRTRPSSKPPLGCEPVYVRIKKLK